jgi:hypothetical protein
VVAVPTPAPETQLETEALQEFLIALREIPLVERISYSTTPGVLHIWVLSTEEDEWSERRMAEAEITL